MTLLPPTSESLSARFDPDTAQWCFEGSPAGPAGLAVVALAPDVRLVVDAVDPTRVVELTVDLDDCDTAARPSELARQTVGALCGHELAGLLLTVPIEEPADPAGRPVALDPATTPGRALAGRLALLMELADLDAARGDPSPWWAVEEACVRDELSRAVGLAHIRGPEARAAAAAGFVLDFAGRSLDRLGAPQRARLLRRLRSLGQVLASSRPDLGSMLGRLEGPLLVPDDTVAAQFEMLTADLPDPDDREPEVVGRLDAKRWTELGHRSARGPARSDEPIRFEASHDVDVVPAFVDADQRIVIDWYRSRDELLASVSLRPGATPDEIALIWVRVHVRQRNRPPALVDMSQATLEAGRADRVVARLLVPRGLSSGQLLVDVTLRPNEPPLTPAARARHRALRLGVVAAASQRRRAREAPAQWIACHSEWVAAGDEDRAALALRYAARDLPATLTTPLLERANQLLAAPGGPGVVRYPGELGPIPEPFDAEVFGPA